MPFPHRSSTPGCFAGVSPHPSHPAPPRPPLRPPHPHNPPHPPPPGLLPPPAPGLVVENLPQEGGGYSWRLLQISTATKTNSGGLARLYDCPPIGDPVVRAEQPWASSVDWTSSVGGGNENFRVLATEVGNNASYSGESLVSATVSYAAP